MANPQIGQTENGFSYIGGDPSKQESWKKVGEIEDGHVFKGGDPSKQESWELAQQQPVQKQTDFGKELEAGLESFGQQATFGYLPQIQAAIEPAIQKGLSVFLPKDPEGFTVQEAPSTYLTRRGEYIKRSQELAKESPTATLVGGLAGGLTSGVATGGALGKVLGVGARAAGVGGRVGQAALTGAATGAVRNPGDVEGEVSPLQAEKRVENIVSDALTGAIFQGGAESLGKIGQTLKKAPEALKEFSQVKAFKASGAMLKDFRKAYGKGKVGELGQAMIDNGVVAMGDDIGDIAAKSEAAKQISGEKIGEIYNKADAKGSISSSDIRNMVQDYSNDAADRLSGTINKEKVAEKINSVIETISENPNPTFGELRKLRASIDDEINFAKTTQDLPVYQQELLNIRNKLQDMIKSKLGQIDPKLQQDFIKENKNFSNLAEISKIAGDKLQRESANAVFGLRERIQGGLGGVVGGMAGGVPGAIAGAALGSISTKVARQYGTPFVAITANKVAKALENNPQILGKYSDALLKASSVSPKEFVTAVNLMMKKPDFMSQVDKIKGP